MPTRFVSRTLFVFFLAGLFVASLAALNEKAPGYMDAEYYFAGGQAIAEGKGLSLPVLWNYLDDPLALPHSSHTYWMPLVSLIAALGISLGGQFVAARIPFLVLTGLVPPLTVFLGLRLHGNTRNAILGGILALLPVYYLAYMPTSDSFALLMVLGGSIFLLIGARSRPILRTFGIGAAVGLLHLTRADGILWLIVVLAWAVWAGSSSQGSKIGILGRIAACVVAGLAGYLLPMSFWYARNWIEWRQIFPPGGSRAFWLTQYEDTFLFPASQLTVQRWLSSGWQAILIARENALLANLQTFVAVQTNVALAPFVLVGLWQMRKQAAVRAGVGMWSILLLLMSLVFPFAGTNGAFFHSGAVFQPLFWAAAPVGIERIVSWVAALRKWQHGATVRWFLEILLVTVLLLLTVMTYVQRTSIWNAGLVDNLSLEQQLVDLGARPGEAVMVNAPPGYYLATSRPAIVIPYGNESAILAAGRQYHTRYLVLDQANAWYLDRLYSHPGDYPGFHFMLRYGDARIYALTTP